MADEPAAGGGGGGGGGGDAAAQAKGALDNPIMVLILGFVTCNLFSLYWMWVRTKEMNEKLGKQAVNPMFVFPGCICFPVFIYADFLFAKGFDEWMKKEGKGTKDEFVIHFILLLFLAPVGQFMMQQKLNEGAK